MANAEQMDTTIPGLYHYILGNANTGVAKNVPRLDNETLQNFLTMLAEDEVAKSVFDAYEVHSDFYATMTDFQHFVPKELQAEVFYAAKVGYYYREIPSFCTYLIMKAWEEVHHIPNLIVKVLPVSAMKKFFQTGYFTSGICLRDVICNLCCPEYEPISDIKPYNEMPDFTEVYVPSTDMVAAVPKNLGDIMKNATNYIKYMPNGLMLNGIYIRGMGGYVGAVNSVYDLREIV